MMELVRILDKYMVEHFKRAVERLEKRKDEDYDEVTLLIFYFIFENFGITIYN